jgi:hypothetical protein
MVVLYRARKEYIMANEGNLRDAVGMGISVLNFS